jgi:hypothetical protein
VCPPRHPGSTTINRCLAGTTGLYKGSRVVFLVYDYDVRRWYCGNIPSCIVRGELRVLLFKMAGADVIVAAELPNTTFQPRYETHRSKDAAVRAEKRTTTLGFRLVPTGPSPFEILLSYLLHAGSVGAGVSASPSLAPEPAQARLSSSIPCRLHTKASIKLGEL